MDLQDIVEFLQKGNFDTKQLDPKVISGLSGMGLNTGALQEPSGEAPYTRAGISNLLEASAPQLVGMNITGLTTPLDPKNGQKGSFVVSAPDEYQFQTRAHEYEHALAQQGLGKGSRINQMFDSLVSNDGTGPVDRMMLSDNLIKHSDHLVKNWGLDPQDTKGGYFSPDMGRMYPTGGMLHEQLATLSALEQQRNKRLVDDPYIRENVLTTPALREAYNAVTGLRQSRLDARDLPPYTRQNENPPPYKPPSVPQDGTLQKIINSLMLWK